MARKYPLTNVELTDIKVNKTEAGQSITISWASKDIGFGTYTFQKGNKKDDPWEIYSEYMDANDDKGLGEVLLKQFLDICKDTKRRKIK